jgi:hypothetical protein
MLAIPPMTTIVTRRTDTMNPKDPGLMKQMKWA